MRLPMPCRHDQQMQVMVAQHGERSVAQRLHRAQYRQRIGTAVDQIADQPQSVARAIEGDQIEQLSELGVTALDIADDVVAHGRSGSSRVAKRGSLKSILARDSAYDDCAATFSARVSSSPTL